MARISTTSTDKKAGSGESSKQGVRAVAGTRQAAKSMSGKSAASGMSAGASASASKTPSPASSQGAAVSKAQASAASREEMIAMAAYFRAEHRGFTGGDPVADWLAAEAEIEAMLKTPPGMAVH